MASCSSMLSLSVRHAPRTARRSSRMPSPWQPCMPVCSTNDSAAPGTCCAHPEQQQHLQPGTSRRDMLLKPALVVAMAALLQGQPAEADSQDLPKAYQELVRKLAKSLRESIEAEQAGAKEAEVRRKADPAKEALQMFVKRWRDDFKVSGHPSHTQVMAVLSELGAFYQAAGPRARMPTDVQERLLGHLAAAEEALVKPPPGQSDQGGQEPPSQDDDLLRNLLPA